MSESFTLDTLQNLIHMYPDNIISIKYYYLALLSQLTTTVFLDTDLFMHNIRKIHTMGAIYVLYTSVPTKEDFCIIATGTVIVEPKIFREGKNVGHIEDIVVIEHMRNKGLSQIILNKLKQHAKENNCYKIILNCAAEVQPVYSKNGFTPKDIQMVEYF
jgi:glucosamine-phosphate N-acetyltransferase